MIYYLNTLNFFYLKQKLPTNLLNTLLKLSESFNDFISDLVKTTLLTLKIRLHCDSNNLLDIYTFIIITRKLDSTFCVTRFCK